MTKYMNRAALTGGQEAEAFPLLDAALALPFGKAVFYTCTKSRANYLARVLIGECYRNAIQSLSTYLQSEPLYGKGLYYHLVIEQRQKGLIIANVENPPATLTWLIIKCAAERRTVSVSGFSSVTVQSRLNKLKERCQEIRHVYFERNLQELRCAIPSPEEMVVVDIDVGGHVRPPSVIDRAKVGQ